MRDFSDGLVVLRLILGDGVTAAEGVAEGFAVSDRIS